MSGTVSHRRARRWLLAFGFWTLLAMSYAVSMILTSMSEGQTLSWQRALAWNLPNFYLWMALTPLVGYLGRSTASRDWRGFWSVHLPSSIAIAALQTLLMLTLYWLLRGSDGARPVPLPQLLHDSFIYQFHLGLLTYWLLLVVLRGIDSERRLKDERLRNAQLETQLAQSELSALRMQLQPHFLFNTLNAISALALSDPSRARLMIARLSDFLRLTLEERHLQHVPLSRELQFLECYLSIQKVRFQDKLATRLDAAGDALNASVPNLILQPLVENALRHGLLPKKGKGTLRITARRKGDDLHVLLEDDGLGLPAKGFREGIGLGNTRARLEMLFGKAARLDLTRIAAGGTRVELHFPYREYAS